MRNKMMGFVVALGMFLLCPSFVLAEVAVHLSLERNGPIVKVWMTNVTDTPQTLSGVTLPFSIPANVGPISVTCPLSPAFFYPLLNVPEDIHVWDIVPKMGRRKAPDPPRKWQRRTDVEIKQLVVSSEDVGQLALNWDTMQLWRLSNVDPVEWEVAGCLPYIWDAVTLPPGEAVLLMPLRGDRDLGDVAIRAQDTSSRYRLLVFLKPECGRWARTVAWDVVPFVVGELPSPLDTYRLLRHLLESDVPRTAQALDVLNEVIGDDG